jgi:hypothetical protein
MSFSPILWYKLQKILKKIKDLASKKGLIQLPSPFAFPLPLSSNYASLVNAPNLSFILPRVHSPADPLFDLIYMEISLSKFTLQISRSEAITILSSPSPNSRKKSIQIFDAKRDALL